MARTEGAPQTKHRQDYRPADFRVEGIDLSFDIRDGHTIVTVKDAK